MISSNSFALQWRIYSSEVENLKWFCFDLALKLALYTSKKKKKQSHYMCVSYKAKSRWQVSLVSVRKLASQERVSDEKRVAVNRLLNIQCPPMSLEKVWQTILRQFNKHTSLHNIRGPV